MNQSDKAQMLRYIQELGFAIDDVVLYLDTHPTDQDALAYFHHFREVRMKALKEYEENFGPLTLDTTKPEHMWLWSTQPMPWEGGAC